MKNRNVFFTIWLIRFDWLSICEWYVVKYNNKTSSFLNTVFQKFEKNLKFLFDIIVLKKSQSTIFKRFNNVFFYLTTNYVFLSIFVNNLVENVIVLTKILNMQINYIYETKFKYVLRCSNRRIYDFLLEICFFKMMRSQLQ